MRDQIDRLKAVDDAARNYRETVVRLWKQYEAGLISQAELQLDIANSGKAVQKIVSLQVGYKAAEKHAGCCHTLGCQQKPVRLRPMPINRSGGVCEQGRRLKRGIRGPQR
jgi:hypothetical protein